MQLSYEMSPRTKRMLGELRVSTRGLRGALLASARDVAIALQREVVEGLSGKTLDVRTGALRRSVDAKVAMDRDAIKVLIGVTKGRATRYAKIQEEGGTIRAKPGRAMAIPISRRTKTPAGVGKWPRDLPATIKKRMFLHKAAGKDAVLMLGFKQRKPELMYALKRKVTIQPTYWLSGPIEQKAPKIIPRVIGKAMDRQLASRGG